MHRNGIDAVRLGAVRCSSCAIRDLVLFGDLRDQDFDLIHIPIDELRFQSGATLYSAGDEGGSLYTIRGGLVKLVQFLPDGTQRIVRLLRRGAVAGLEVLVGKPYEHTAVVLQEAETCRLPRAVVERLSKETPRLHARLMERWYQSLHQADEWLTELSTGSARRRLARLFLKLAADAPSEPVLLSGREDLGAMLGVGMETASRTIAEFKRAGLVVERAPNVFVCDLAALEAVALDG